MCSSTFNQIIWIDYLENITKEQEKGEAQCQNAGLNVTIHYATFFAATVCSNWKLYAPNVWVHTNCQLFLQSVSATLSQPIKSVNLTSL